MKINNIKIKIVRAERPEVKRHAAVVVGPLAVKAKAIEKLEIAVRDAIALALKKSGASAIAAVSLPALDFGVGFPDTAAAKITAQETFRFVRGQKHRLNEILFVISRDEDFKIFNKVFTGYLRHLLDIICAGPFVTVDAIIETAGGIVLVKRSNPPYGWALPGGFVDYGESIEEAVKREVKEETGLCAVRVRQMHTYSRPNRDSRFHTISAVFITSAKGRLKAASDAADAGIFKPAEWQKLPLAFDHREILKDYLRR